MYTNVCIMRDFNYRNADWIDIAADHESDDLINIIQDNFLKQIVSEPTRKDSIMDLDITNKDNLVNNMEIGWKLGSSDHPEILFWN